LCIARFCVARRGMGHCAICKAHFIVLTQCSGKVVAPLRFINSTGE
jgi:hypothetical protein